MRARSHLLRLDEAGPIGLPAGRSQKTPFELRARDERRPWDPRKRATEVRLLSDRPVTSIASARS